MYASALAALVALAVTVNELARPAEPPSIVLITIDSLRADHLGVYGYSRDTSPNIDALAREGVVFENAFTVDTLSGPSHASIFTSLFPVTHGVVYNGYELVEEATTMAELLQGAGYRTAGFVSDWLLGRDFGFDQGFRRFEKSQVRSRAPRQRLLSTENRSYQLALRWLQVQRGERYFLWLHCQQPHFSYDPLPPYDVKFDPDIPANYLYRHFETMREAHRQGRLTAADRRRVTALYDGEIAFTDHLLGPLFEELREQREDVLVVLTSDHGDLLFEPGEPGHVGHGHGNFYDGALRVPLIVVPPAGLEGWVPSVTALVSTIDLLPTIAELTGIELPAGTEGRSLVGLLDGSAGSVRDEIRAMYVKDDESPTFALRTADRKLIYRSGTEPRHELYDLAADPAETRDVSGDRPEETARLTERVLEWFRDRPDRFPDAQRGLSPAVRELLRQGGYLDTDDD